MSETLTLPAAKTISCEEALQLDLCATEDELDQVRALFARIPAATAFDILKSDLPVDLRFEIVLHGPFLSKRELQLLACDLAEATNAAFKRIYPFDDIGEPIETARAYAMGWCDSCKLDKHFDYLQGPDGLIYEVSLRRQRSDGDPAPFFRASYAIEAAVAALEGDAYSARLLGRDAVDAPDDWGIELVRQYVQGTAV